MVDYVKSIHHSYLSKHLLPQTTPQKLPKVDQTTPSISQVVIEYHSCPTSSDGIESTITIKGDHLWFCERIVIKLIDGTLIEEVEVCAKDVSRRLYQCEGDLNLLESSRYGDWLELDVVTRLQESITVTVPVKINVSFILRFEYNEFLFVVGLSFNIISSKSTCKAVS